MPEHRTVSVHLFKSNYFIYSDQHKSYTMKLLVNFTLLATLAAVGSTAFISTIPRGANRPQIAATEDIPDLPEGFTWDIVERPKGNDTRIRKPVSNADVNPKDLEKRAMGITCTGVGTIITKPGKIRGRVCTDQNTACREPPLE